MRERIKQRITEWRYRVRVWLDLKIPIPMRPVHLGSAHNFIIAPIPTFTYKQHLRLLIRTFLREVCGV